MRRPHVNPECHCMPCSQHDAKEKEAYACFQAFCTNSLAKAHTCVKIARRLLPVGASDNQIEEKAADLMKLSEDDLNAIGLS